MDPLVIAGVALGAFVAGVIFNKYVISEAAAVKAHVTAEVTKVREDVASLLEKAAGKV
jgi:hypothetical protein